MDVRTRAGTAVAVGGEVGVGVVPRTTVAVGVGGVGLDSTTDVAVGVGTIGWSGVSPLSTPKAASDPMSPATAVMTAAIPVRIPGRVVQKVRRPLSPMRYYLP